jgi:hypothetical protein
MSDYEPDEETATVEWGEDDERRSRWWDRILGREAEGRAGPAEDPGGAGSPARHAGLNRPAIVCAVAGFAFAVAAQVLPWARIATGALGIDARNNLGTDRLMLGQLASFQVPAYNAGWLLLFACASALLVVQPPARRILTAVAVGLTAGQMVCILGIGAAVKGGGDLIRFADPETAKVINYGEGFYGALAAIVMLVVSIALANRQQRRAVGRGPKVAVEEIDELVDDRGGAGPVDLTVTPLRPMSQGTAERWAGR